MNNSNTPKLSDSQVRNLARLIEVGGGMVRQHLTNSHTGFHIAALESLVKKGMATAERTIIVECRHGNHNYTIEFTVTDAGRAVNAGRPVITETPENMAKLAAALGVPLAAPTPIDNVTRSGSEICALLKSGMHMLTTAEAARQHQALREAALAVQICETRSTLRLAALSPAALAARVVAGR